MGYLVRGRIPAERDNPINRTLIRWYGERQLAMLLRLAA